jgi:membrane protein YdbS with pleckstrin-like domain
MNETNGYRSLSRKAVNAWRINGGLWALVLWLAPAFFVSERLFEGTFSWWTISVSAGIAALVSILLVFVMPEIRWRQWQYKVDEHEIDLHYGIWFTRRTLVPVKRVQHVDTRQGPVLRRYALADVVISTAATTHKIPALQEVTADRARSEISRFAREAKDDI